MAKRRKRKPKLTSSEYQLHNMVVVHHALGFARGILEASPVHVLSKTQLAEFARAVSSISYLEDALADSIVQRVATRS